MREAWVRSYRGHAGTTNRHAIRAAGSDAQTPVFCGLVAVACTTCNNRQTQVLRQSPSAFGHGSTAPAASRVDARAWLLAPRAAARVQADVGAGATVELVDTSAAVEVVVAEVAEQDVVPVAAAQVVAVPGADEGVVAAASVEEVVTVAEVTLG